MYVGWKLRIYIFLESNDVEVGRRHLADISHAGSMLIISKSVSSNFNMLSCLKFACMTVA